jgi:hypothetical protein
MPANDWRERFLAEPPKLAGGVELAVEREGDHLLLRLSHGTARAELRAAFLAVPYPSGLRRALASRPELEAVIVEHIPSGLDDAAAEAGISYLDPRGDGRVVAPGFVYVAPSRFPSALRNRGEDVAAGPPEPERRPRRVSPFAPKASRLVRCLLAEPQRSWRLSEAAAAVEVDRGNAHRVLGALVDLGLVERDEDRYSAPDPGSLLEAWAEAARPERDRLVLHLSVDPQGWVSELVSSRPEGFAVSGELAAELLAPYLQARQVLLHCLDLPAFDLLRESGGAPAGVGLPATGRVIAAPADEGIGDFGSTVAGLPLVSPAQLYVDLFRQRGRGREAAEHVRREILGF